MNQCSLIKGCASCITTIFLNSFIQNRQGGMVVKELHSDLGALGSGPCLAVGFAAVSLCLTHLTALL